MPKKQWTEAERKAFADKMAASRAAKIKQKPQTKKVAEPAEAQSQTPQQNQVVMSQEQFNQLIAALSAGKVDQAPASAFTNPVNTFQTNAFGQTVGIVQKFNPDASYYPNPVDELMALQRLRRFSMFDNYYLTWEVTSKPYETKYGTNVVEPTFHLTLYATMFDEDGEIATDKHTGEQKYVVVQAFHFNEDEQLAMDFAAEHGFEPTHENMRQIMNDVRFERAKRWLLSVFFPEHTFDPNTFESEQAIEGQVVKIVTKSNVKGFGNKTPKIEIDELQ